MGGFLLSIAMLACGADIPMEEMQKEVRALAAKMKQLLEKGEYDQFVETNTSGSVRRFRMKYKPDELREMLKMRKDVLIAMCDDVLHGKIEFKRSTVMTDDDDIRWNAIILLTNRKYFEEGSRLIFHRENDKWHCAW